MVLSCVKKSYNNCEKLRLRDWSQWAREETRVKNLPEARGQKRLSKTGMKTKQNRTGEKKKERKGKGKGLSAIATDFVLIRLEISCGSRVWIQAPATSCRVPSWPSPTEWSSSDHCWHIPLGKAHVWVLVTLILIWCNFTVCDCLLLF